MAAGSNLSLGRVFIDMGVRRDKSFSEAPKEVDKLKSSSNSLLGSLKQLRAGMLAASAAVAATTAVIGAGVAHVVSLGDKLTNLSAKTGLSTDFLQQLSHAAGQLGTPFDSAANAISKLQVNLGKTTTTLETTDALQALGLELGALAALKPEEQFMKVAESLKGVVDPAQQAAAAQALFGRGGLDLLPLLRGNYAELMQQASDLGIVLDKDLLEAGDALGDNWNTLQTVGMSLLGQAVGPLVNEMASLSTAMLDVVKSSNTQIAELQRQMEIEGQVQSLLESGVSFKQAQAIAAERNHAAAIAATNLELRNAVTASAAAHDAAVTLNAQQLASAPARVAAALQAKAHNDELSKVAGFVGLALPSFLAMDAAFIANATNQFQAVTAAKAHDEALAGIIAKVPTFLSLFQSWREEQSLTTESSFLFAEMQAEIMTGVMNDTVIPFIDGYRMVGGLKAATDRAMLDSFARMGTGTRQNAAQMRDQLIADFEAIKAANIGSTEEMLQAAEDFAARKMELDKAIKDNEIAMKQEGAAGIDSILRSLGGKFRAFALAQMAVDIQAGIVGALRAPWPLSLVEWIKVAAIGARAISQVKSVGFEHGTPNLDFANFGSEMPAMLHGQEAVIPRGGGHALAKEIANEMRSMGGGGGTSGPVGGGNAGGQVVIQLVTPNGDELVTYLIPSIEKLTKSRRLRIHPNGVAKEF